MEGAGAGTRATRRSKRKRKGAPAVEDGPARRKRGESSRGGAIAPAEPVSLKPSSSSATVPWYHHFTKGNVHYEEYMENEWAHPLHDDQRLFECLILEGAQAGLSWATILNKRENYRKAFDNFDIAKVSAFDAKKQKDLLENKGIVRHAGKISAAIVNAQATLQVQKEFGSLDSFLWSFVGGSTLPTKRLAPSDIPSKTPESICMSKDLVKRGFKFVGPTICYAFMQAVGMVNDHPTNTRQWAKISSMS